MQTAEGTLQTMRVSPIETAADLHQLGALFCDAKVVLAAVELRLFTEISQNPLTQEQVCDRCELNPRAVRDFLSVLVTLGLLEHEDGRYGNSPVAERFLNRRSEEYAGGFLERANRMMYPVWEHLSSLLRTGDPQAKGREDQAAAFERMMADPEHVKRVLDMMDALTDSLGPELARAPIPWDRYSTVVDIGGGRGNVLARVLDANPGLSGYVFDLPAVEHPFYEHVEKFGLLDRARFVGGDFFVDPLPVADVLIIGHVLHDWSAEERRALIGKAYAAVADGGLLLIYDQLTGAGRVDDTWNSIISLNMQLLSPGGSEYSPAEAEEWRRTAGFAQVTIPPLGAHDSLIIARKNG